MSDMWLSARYVSLEKMRKNTRGEEENEFWDERRERNEKRGIHAKSAAVQRRPIGLY